MFTFDFDEFFNKLSSDIPKILPQEGDTLVRCSTCKGKGKIKMHNEETGKPEKVTCPDCNGTCQTIKTLNY